MLISSGLQGDTKNTKQMLVGLFGGRYHKRHYSEKIKTMIRDATMLGSADDNEQNVPFAGFVNPDNPESGPYGGTSLIWFPTAEHGSLITFVVGTRGISPDEGILTRPGHQRRIAALRRMLARLGVEAWSKPDPANINNPIPVNVTKNFPGFENTFKRYGQVLYCVAKVPTQADIAVKVVQSFLDLYSYERGWEILTAYSDQRQKLLGELRQDLFESVTPDFVNDLLKSRRFVILQGPPGTGKTRLAEQVKKHHFNDNGMIIQFHPAITYEDFVVGLSPEISKQESLFFDVKPGYLVKACQSASTKPFLLVIDEINRADLGKILGEAIYLFEPDEPGRTIELSHSVNGSKTLTLPENLYVLGTMNTADRSIASIDLAIRRRFAFVTMMPEREVVAAQNIDMATAFFDRIVDIFVEHAASDVFNLMPGHSYFLAKDENELKKRFKFELLPLLNEYLREGYLGQAATELNAVRDAIEDAVK